MATVDIHSPARGQFLSLRNFFELPADITDNVTPDN